FGQLGIAPAGADEIGERAEHAVAEVVADLQQRLRRIPLPTLVAGQRQLFAQLAALAIQGRALDFERACRLRATLERVFQLAHGAPLGGQAAAYVVFFAGPRTELALNRGEITLGSGALGGRSLVFALGLRRAAFRLHAVIGRRLPPLARVAQSLGGKREIALQPADFELRVAQP